MLRGIAQNAAEVTGLGPAEASRDRDVFISHATEDNEVVVRPLAHALRDKGLNVSDDKSDLRIGDSLRRKIDAGIARSSVGVVVLS